MIALLGAMLAFLLLHGRLDRSEAKLSGAPLDDHDQSLDFQ